MLKARTATVNSLSNLEEMTPRGGAPRTYSVGQVVTLDVPPKKSAEATQLPCRVLKITKGAYTLLSFYGRLKGLHPGSLLKALPTHEGFGMPMKADPSKELITAGTAVNLSKNWESLLEQLGVGAEATKKRKRNAEEEENALAAQESESVVVQDGLDEQFARDVEAAVAGKDKVKQKKGKLKL
jgi:hypothetical protein